MAQNNPYENGNPYNGNPYTNNPYNGNPYSGQAAPYAPKRKDSVYTKKIKDNFPFFGIGSAIYAVFYTFCLYKNASGITYPFFVVGTLCYFFFSMQKLGVPYKKDSIFFIISITLLGISNCLTTSPQLLIMNKCGIFLLAFVLMIHTLYMDRHWNLPKYFGALFQMIGTVFICVFRPLSDMASHFSAKKQKNNGKKSYFIPILIGIVIAIPTLLFMTALLASADAVFADIFSRILDSINLETIFGTTFMTIVVFFASYAVYAALGMKVIKEEVTDHRSLEPIIAIIVTAALSIVYLMFSIIQILYLFIGNMQLPDGYTYSGYAREGFFQLLVVCILNLILVLICLYLFRENKVLKAILTIICGCTYIMILSSALRMMMYINRYNLTFLRIFVLWSLAVIFFVMAGVTISIYKNQFPLFTYSMVVVTLFYICLSFAHPDYLIAKYNLSPEHIESLDDYDSRDSQNYFSRLSSDAAPILLDQTRNPYLAAYDGHFTFDPEESESEECRWLYRYYSKIANLSDEMHIRNFNFSIHRAEKYLY